MTTPTFNKFKSTTIYGNITNSDYPDSTVLASANFARNITIGGDISMPGKVTTVNTIDASNNSIVTKTTSLGNQIITGNLSLGSLTNVVTKDPSGNILTTTNTANNGIIYSNLISTQKLYNFGLTTIYNGAPIWLKNLANTAYSTIVTQTNGNFYLGTFNYLYQILLVGSKVRFSADNVNFYDVLTTQTGVVPATLNNYVLSTALNTTLNDYALTSTLNNYALTSSLSSYASLSGATFSGNVYAPTVTLTDSSTQIATTEFVKSQGYLTSFSGGSYAPVTNPTNGANNYASITAIATTYQTIASMFSYLTTSSAAASYQAKTDMASYLTTALASTTYLTKTLAASTYITTSIAVGVFQSKGDMTNYAPLSNPSFTGNVTAAEWVLSKQAQFSQGIIELGTTTAGATISRIDMKTTNGDYDVRISQSGGSSTVSGQGSLTFEASTGSNFTGFVSTSVAPTSANHLCNKTYVDSVLVNGSLNNQYSKAKILV